MKKILALIFFFAIMLIGAQGALAQVIDIPNPLGPEGSTIPGLVSKIAGWLLNIGLAVSTIVILWAALVFMTSGGNEKRVTQARQTLWYAIIGLAVLLLAKSIAGFVVKLISG